MSSTPKSLNYLVLLIFAPILILTGILGFIVPVEKGLMSGAPAYNVFHLLVGSIGLLLALTRNETWIRTFNISFGVTDLYQAVASFLHLFPEQIFLWKPADDVVHIVIGVGLVLVGLSGRSNPRLDQYRRPSHQPCNRSNRFATMSPLRR